MKIFIIFAVIILSGFFLLPRDPIEYQSEEFLTPILAQENPLLPKINSDKSIEVDLTSEIINLWKGGQIVLTLPIAYQAREGNWFQTPTGYFRTGIMLEQHKSSLTEVYMPYSIQIYEDFFIHEIPFLEDGTKLTSAYSGGCLRLETEDAKTLFEFAKPNMPVTIFKTFEGLILKDEYRAPVDLDYSWIRQRFNDPIRSTYNYGGDIDKIGLDYDQHTGVDFSTTLTHEGLIPFVFAIDDGVVAGIWRNGKAHGLGNTIIINHGDFYALYAHIDSFEHYYYPVGTKILKGISLGIVGNTGYGCNYWRIGEDGCESKNPPDNHLHFEIKDSSILDNPKGSDVYYGYTPTNPENYGYQNPLKVLFSF